MPSIVTHHIFAKEVKKQLPKKIQNEITDDIFYVFAQSFDNLFYYKFLTPWQGKKIRELGHLAQQEKVASYFENILEYITNNQLEKNKDCLSYLYGSICHYVLDYHCHPFVIYYTGVPSVNLKYRGLHEKMEVNIDAYMYQKYTGKELKSAKLADILLPKTKFSKQVKNTIDYTFLNTFQTTNMGNIYEKSTSTGNFLVKYFVTDTLGIKKQLYKIEDCLMKNSPRKYEYLSFYIPKIYLEYLNENHEIWIYPADKNIKKNDSFLELFEKSLQKACYIITKIDEYFKRKISKKELLTIIGDNSYTTGLPISRKLTNKYFKY